MTSPPPQQPPQPSWQSHPYGLQPGQGVPPAPQQPQAYGAAPQTPYQPAPAQYWGAPPQQQTPYSPNPYGYLPVPPRKPSAAPKVVGTVFALVLLVVAVAIGANLGSPTAQVQEAASPVPPRPDVGASDKEWEDYIGPAALQVLAPHAQALIDGDEAGWLAVFDQDDAQLIDAQRQRFNSLRALETTNWTYDLDGRPEADGGSGENRRFEIDLIVGYCFGASDPANCLPTDVIIPTEWTIGPDAFHITEVDPSAANQGGPRPFEVSELTVQSTDRVIVAATPEYADQLPNAVDVAADAAENADKYARWRKVDRYVVFLAGNDEFEEWYGTGGISANVVGFATTLGHINENGDWEQTGIEVVMHVERLTDSAEFVSTMRHEFGHVVTLLGMTDHREQEEAWFLDEGIAEYIDYGPGDVDGYPRMQNVADYIDRDGWNGQLDPPTETDDGLAGSAKYGLAFLGVHHMIATYGEDAFFQFYEAVARKGEDADTSAQAAFGKDFEDLRVEIEDFVTSVV